MSPSSLALLGQIIDPDSRIDAYNACLIELEQDQRLYETNEINDAVRLARKDLKLFESGLQQDLHGLALQFLSFVFSTENLICHVSDQMVMSVFKDLVYVFAKAEGKSCALAAVVVSLEIVSSKRQNLIKRSALPLVPSLAECISIRFPGVTFVVKEVILAIARLCKVVPDTMHALRCSWAHCVLPIALRFSESEVQTHAIICLEAVHPSSCTVGRELYKRAVAELNENELSKMHRMASEIERSLIVSAIWSVCMRCLGIYVFRHLKLWNELASIWKKCFSHGRPDIAIACLESWSIVIEAATTNPEKLQDLRLMRLIARPFMFMFDNNPKRSEYIQVSVRMKAIDIWSQFLNVVKCHRVSGEIFQEIVRPVILKMLLSGEGAILIAACNLLGSFFSTRRDYFALTSQHSFSIVNSQLYDLSSENDRAQYFNEIFPHFIPVFKALLNHQKLSPDIKEFEFGAIKNSWRFFLSNLSQLDLNVVQNVLKELIVCDLDIGHYPIRFQYIECMFAVVPPSIWFGEDHTSVIESPAGRICDHYLAAFTDGQQAKYMQMCTIREEWPKFTMALSSACHQHRVEQRLVLLCTHFLEPIFRNEKLVSRHNVLAFINLARAACTAIFQNAPVKYNVRYFHAICMDLLHNILSSKDLGMNVVANNCFQQQVQRFALFLLRSIVTNESFPVDSILLKEYEPGLISLLQSCPTLKVYTCKFLDQAFGITPYFIPKNIFCSQKLREAILTSSLSGNNNDLMSQSANTDQEAYNVWHTLNEKFEAATEKLLNIPLCPDLRSKVLERIMEQRIYFDGLMSISSELSYTKQR